MERAIDIEQFVVEEPIWDTMDALNFYVCINFDADAYFGIDVTRFDTLDAFEDYSKNGYINFYAIYDVERKIVKGRYFVHGLEGNYFNCAWDFNKDEEEKLIRAMNECCLNEDGVDLENFIKKYRV